MNINKKSWHYKIAASGNPKLYPPTTFLTYIFVVYFRILMPWICVPILIISSIGILNNLNNYYSILFFFLLLIIFGSIPLTALISMLDKIFPNVVRLKFIDN